MRNTFFIFFVLFVFSGPVFAATTGYQPLAPIPGLTTVQTGGDSTKSGQGLAQYLRSLYTFGIGAAVALAIIVIMFGGIEYITSGSGDGKSGGKERIQSAILGLLLALGSYIILKTINPDLLNLTFKLDLLKVEETPVRPPGEETPEQRAALQRLLRDTKNRTDILDKGIDDAKFAIWLQTLHYEDAGYKTVGDHSVQRINYSYATDLNTPGTTAIAPIGTYKIGDKIFIQSLSGREVSDLQFSNGIVTVIGINNDPFSALKVNMGYKVPSTNLQNQPSNVILREPFK